MDGVAGTLEAIRDGLVDVGIPPRSIENEWGPGQIEITFSPMEGLAAADAMILFRSTVKAVCARLGPARDVHVLAGAAELLPERLAPPPVAARDRERPQRLRGRPRAPVADRPPVRRRAARPRAGDGRLRRPDDERVRALPPVLVRTRPHLLGRRTTAARSSASRAARATPARTSRTGSRSRPRTRTCGSPRTSRRASTASTAAPIRRRPSRATRTWPTRRSCRSPSPRPSTTSSAARSTERRSAIRSSTTS